jgi:hypothetical protein
MSRNTRTSHPNRPPVLRGERVRQEDGVDGSGPTEEVVLGLTRNVRDKLGSDWAVGESGTAGPTGGHQPNRTPYDPQFPIPRYMS